MLMKVSLSDLIDDHAVLAAGFPGDPVCDADRDAHVRAEGVSAFLQDLFPAVFVQNAAGHLQQDLHLVHPLLAELGADHGVGQVFARAYSRGLQAEKSPLYVHALGDNNE